MKAHVVTKLQIAAPPDAVFEYLAELRYHYLWNPHLQGKLPDKRLQLNISYRSTSLQFGMKMRANNVVTEFVPGKLLELRNVTGMVQYNVRYRLESRDGGTWLTCSTSVSSESRSYAFAKPILKLLAQRELNVDLQLLKTAVEEKLH